MDVTIHNRNPSVLETQLLKEVVRFIAPPLKTDVSVTFDANDSWDGSCYYMAGKAEVIVPIQGYPHVWWVNPELPGQYQCGGVLYSIEEFLIWLTAHEMAHFYFHHFQGKRNQCLNTRSPLLEGIELDEEMECDLYAMMKLNAWRRKGA